MILDNIGFPSFIHFLNHTSFNSGYSSGYSSESPTAPLRLNRIKETRIRFKLSLLFVILILVSPASQADSKKFFGGDIVDMEVNLGYAQGADTYVYKGTRFRYGVESDIGIALGVEYTTPLTDEAYNAVGTPFELEVRDTIGLYFTAGTWAYVKIGVSSWKTEYTHVATGLSNRARMNTMEYGLGFKIPIGSHLTVYGEYMQKNANVNYPSFFLKVGIEHGDLMYDSELYAAGVYFSF